MPGLNTPQIEYAPRPVRWLGRGRVRQLLLLCAVVVFGLCVWSWVPVVLRHVERIKAQRDCLAHTPPPQLVSFKAEGWSIVLIWSRPLEFDRLLESSRGKSIPWTKVTPRGALLFLHERHMPNGPKRLVVVSFDQKARSNPLSVQVMELGTFRPLYVRSYDRSGFPQFWPKPDWGSQSEPSKPFQIFEGRPDANDSTHFTIPYELDGQHGIVDGWLVEDQFVKLEVRPVTTGN